MHLKDTARRYGLISRWNHWLGAGLVIALLAIGIYFHEMPRGDERLFWMRLHVGGGLLALMPLLWRIGWRAASRSPAALAQPKLLQWVTRGVHGLLLWLLVVLMMTGPFIVWSVGAPLEAFGLFALPSPMEKFPVLHEMLETVHAVAGKAMLPLIGLHLLASLKHLLWDRGAALGRMT